MPLREKFRELIKKADIAPKLSDGLHATTEKDRERHRFSSFAPERDGNRVKWFVDGCGYFWAVSEAIENAKESIWILDWWLSPEIYLRRPPSKNERYRLDRMLLAAAERGVSVNIIVYKEVTQVLTLSSWHTKHHLEDLHPKICVIRHPDHLPTANSIAHSLIDKFKSLTLTAAEASKLGRTELESIYGTSNDVILYWAHHEKLCVVDGNVAFMGGLDMCFGRWDTNDHPIADAHPTDLELIVFPGQDYNNSRVMDFANVQDWEANKLSRTESSRMGWSDISLTLAGPVVEDLCWHFADRWNFIYAQKYKDQPRYSRLELSKDGSARNANENTTSFTSSINRFLHRHDHPDEDSVGNTSCQITRSCTKWSAGVTTETSIANAYVKIIAEAEHFIYIENQFFITATGENQKPVENKIGKAISDRIIRAGREGKKFKIIVLMPAIPAFAGDLRDDASLGTRAIMEYQYNSICRGGHSIMETIEKAGFKPLDYIRFYNLRNYDRINVSLAMKQIESDSGVNYETARKEHDDIVGAGYSGMGEGTSAQTEYGQYQEIASKVENGWDTVSSCYMDGGDLNHVPWEEGNVPEIDAFVSEELYIHSKVLIADDQTVICGSANLNDRSQLGRRDSEIAVIVRDNHTVESVIDGQPWQASRFASSLRRQLFRKHLGLLPPQDMEKPDGNFHGINVSNAYDWGSDEDKLVEDPLSDQFQELWKSRAKKNTQIFGRVFQPVPHDSVQTWSDYDKWYTQVFTAKEGKPKYEYGHVVRDNFDGIAAVRQALSEIRGTLVEMPLLFLVKEDIAKEGIRYNQFTDDIYT